MQTEEDDEGYDALDSSSDDVPIPLPPLKSKTMVPGKIIFINSRKEYHFKYKHVIFLKLSFFMCTMAVSTSHHHSQRNINMIHSMY